MNTKFDIGQWVAIKGHPKQGRFVIEEILDDGTAVGYWARSEFAPEQAFGEDVLYYLAEERLEGIE
jgi:hypothetical protein